MILGAGDGLPCGSDAPVCSCIGASVPARILKGNYMKSTQTLAWIEFLKTAQPRVIEAPDSPMTAKLRALIDKLFASPDRRLRSKDFADARVIIEGQLRRQIWEYRRRAVYHHVDRDAFDNIGEWWADEADPTKARKEWIEKDGETPESWAYVALTEKGRIAAETLRTDSSKAPKGRKLEWLPKALILLNKHPDWSDREIAIECKVHPSTIARSEPFRRMREAGATGAPPRGTKTKPGDMEALSDDDNVA